MIDGHMTRSEETFAHDGARSAGTEILTIESGGFADRPRVGYRFGVDNPEGSFVVEQQAFYGERDGRIAWMRVDCSGFRPVGA